MFEIGDLVEIINPRSDERKIRGAKIASLSGKGRNADKICIMYGAKNNTKWIDSKRLKPAAKKSVPVVSEGPVLGDGVSLSGEPVSEGPVLAGELVVSEVPVLVDESVVVESVEVEGPVLADEPVVVEPVSEGPVSEGPVLAVVNSENQEVDMVAQFESSTNVEVSRVILANVPVDKIWPKRCHFDAGDELAKMLQPRLSIDNNRVERYALLFDELPPIDVFVVSSWGEFDNPDEELYILGGGFHRREAALSLGLKEIKANVHYAVSINDAIAFANCDNLQHGAQLDKYELTKAVKNFLRVKDSLSQESKESLIEQIKLKTGKQRIKDLSKNAIAQLFGYSDVQVGRYVSEIELEQLASQFFEGEYVRVTGHDGKDSHRSLDAMRILDAYGEIYGKIKSIYGGTLTIAPIYERIAKICYGQFYASPKYCEQVSVTDIPDYPQKENFDCHVGQSVRSWLTPRKAGVVVGFNCWVFDGDDALHFCSKDLPCVWWFDDQNHRAVSKYELILDGDDKLPSDSLRIASLQKELALLKDDLDVERLQKTIDALIIPQSQVDDDDEDGDEDEDEDELEDYLEDLDDDDDDYDEPKSAKSFKSVDDEVRAVGKCLGLPTRGEQVLPDCDDFGECPHSTGSAVEIRFEKFRRLVCLISDLQPTADEASQIIELLSAYREKPQKSSYRVRFDAVVDLLELVDCSFRRYCFQHLEVGFSKNYEGLEPRPQHQFEYLHQLLEEYAKQNPNAERLHELCHHLSNGQLKVADFEKVILGA